MKHIYNDGGRAAAGFTGTCGDCVTRAIAIATEQPYKQVYEAMSRINETYRGKGRASFGKRSGRNGIPVKSQAFKNYMAGLGWTWTPTMHIGSGCKVHLRADELPLGRLIVSVSKHYCAVVDGVVHDTFNPSERGATIYPPTFPNIPKGARQLANGDWAYEPDRCVYGYWRQA